MPDTPLTDAIVALTTYANTITGASDTSLSDAVDTLIQECKGQAPDVLWDLEWDYTQGTPENYGFTKSITGNASELMTSEGLQLKADDSNAAIRYDFPTATMTSGVIEMVVRFDQIATNEINFRASASNGTNGLQILTYNELGIMNNSSPSSCLKLIPIKDNSSWYRIRLALGVTNSDLYVNGLMTRKANANSSIVYCTSNNLRQQNGGTTTIRSIKAKFN